MTQRVDTDDKTTLRDCCARYWPNEIVKLWDTDLTNEDSLKNKDNLKNEDDAKNKDNTINEDDRKNVLDSRNEDDLKNDDNLNTEDEGEVFPKKGFPTAVVF